MGCARARAAVRPVREIPALGVRTGVLPTGGFVDMYSYGA